MKRKSLVLTAMVIFLASGLIAQESAPKARSIMNKAFKEAKRENKNVFLMFHASWCGWCKRMDSLMIKTDCKPLFEDNFVIEHLVVQESAKKKHLENPGAQDMLVKYNGDNQGIPFWLVFDAKGNLLADSRMETKNKEGNMVLANTGCPATQEEVDYWLSVLKKTSRLSEDQLATIGGHFLLKKQ